MKKKELLLLKLPKTTQERHTLITRKKGNGLVIGVYCLHELIIRLWLGNRDFLCVKEYDHKITNKILSDVFWAWDSRAAGFSISYKDFTDGLVVAERDRKNIQKFLSIEAGNEEKIDASTMLRSIIRHEEKMKQLKQKKQISCETEMVKLATREPKDFDSWLERQEVIFLITGRGKKKMAICSHCNGKWDTDLNGNENGECPYCKALGFYKKHDIRSTKVFEYSGVYLGKNKSGEIIEVVKNCHVTYERTYQNRRVDIFEGDRRIIPVKSGDPIYVYCGNGRYRKSYKVFNARGVMYYRHQQYAYMYPDNVKRILKGTALEKYECEKYAKFFSGVTGFFGSYISEMQSAPIAEQIMKGGFREMIYHMLMYRQESIVDDYIKDYIRGKSLPAGKSLAAAMGLSKTQFNELRKKKVPSIEVALTAYMNKQVPEVSSCVVSSYAKLYMLPSKYRMRGVPIGPAIRRKYMLTAAFIDYMSKVHDADKCSFLKDYEDYVGWLEEMGYALNKSNLRPKDFKKKHDEMQKVYAEYREAKKLELLQKESEYMKQIKPIVEELFKIPLSDDDYEIIVPACREELIAESEKLHHCVRNYSKNIYEHSCVIVFIRKKSAIDTPFYTMEINKKCNIQQCRTTGNKSYENSDEMRRLIASYEKSMKENIKRVEHAELLEKLRFQAAA